MKTSARGCRVASGIGAALLCFALVGPAAATGPTAHDLLQAAGFPDDAKRRVLAGEFVSTDIKSSGERELAWAMAFLIKEAPSALIQEVRGWLAVTADPDTLSWGVIHGEGSPADFEKLKLERDAKKQVQVYLKAKPGSALNLDVSEIAAFNALQAVAKDDATAQWLVEQELRRSLLARYRAYRKSGLDGIASYARSGGKTRSPGAELRRAGEASSAIEKVMPSLYKVLLGYPKASAPKLEEAFFWSNYLAHGAPTIILSHRFFMPVGDSYGLVMRQFYVNQGYNNTQAVVAFLPVKRGTLVAYANRTSTDQVGGFGSSSKRAIGRRVMGAQLEKLYAKLRKTAEK